LANNWHSIAEHWDAFFMPNFALQFNQKGVEIAVLFDLLTQRR
jgi:hypothetical protein